MVYNGLGRSTRSGRRHLRTSPKTPKDRLTKLIGEQVEPARLAQDAALADKADIHEELSRVLSHCKQFNDTLKAEEPIGRKLKFLLQELNRSEPIGSKAAEHPISPEWSK